MYCKILKCPINGQSLLIFSLATLLLPTSSFAITLDSFSYTSGSRLTSGAVGQTVSVQQTGQGAIGGTRSVEVKATAAGGTGFEVGFGPFTERTQFPSNLAINSSFTGIGTALLTYDGDNKVGLTNYTGLNSLDLTEGGGNALTMDVIYDYPFNNKNMDLVFTFYDASDTTGNKWSRGVLTLDRQYRDNNHLETLFNVSSGLR